MVLPSWIAWPGGLPCPWNRGTVDTRDPAGGQRSKVFARKADAQRFLNETETAKARGT
jgi:hypothetical protein